MNYDRLCEAIRECQACALGGEQAGVPGMYVGEDPTILVLGEAPGGVEMARGKPFVGQSGELLHSLFKEVGLTSYYVSNIVRHQPPKVKGKQQAPDKVAVEACAPFLRAEFEMVKPDKIILLGATAAKLVVKGQFGMKDVVNTTIEYHRTRAGCPTCRGEGAVLVNPPNDCDFIPCPTCGMDESVPTLILYHPSYFLRSRTAPWIQKQVREWKGAVRLFLGDKAPTYRVERVLCPNHP